MPTMTQPAIGSTSWGTDMNNNLQVLQNQLTNAMQGRVGYVSTTSIRLDRYTGDTVEVNGLNVSIGSGGLTLNSTDNLLSSDGTNSGGSMAASTLYYVYVSNANASYAPSSLRASATQYTTLNGVRYLAASGNGANWRFVGWVRTNSSTQFADSETQRFVINYYNRLDKMLFVCPAYANDNAVTSYTASGNWAKAHSGTDSTVAFISNGEDVSFIQIQAVYDTAASQNPHAGPGIDSTAPTKMGSGYSNTVQTITVNDSQVLSEGYHTVDLYLATSGGAITFYADRGRIGGASVDVKATFLTAIIKA